MPHSTQDNESSYRNGEPIAIVGMSCTLAGGVESPSDLWKTLLAKEIKQSAEIPKSRFNIDAYFHDDAFGRPAAIGSRGGFFLDTELNAFDADFFGYDAEEASHMDPQHFRALESVYECLESAGRTMDDVRGTNTAVYIGNFSLDRVINSARNSYDDRHLHEVIGIDPGLLSSRVSYCYDMSGPVFTTNTGCTSSLFALHTAAMALREGECTSALVGGINLLQGPEAYSSYSKFGIMSPDSMCHSFDARCNGYCRAEGAGTLYVRLLSDAIRDNDPIRGVIRSIAVNSNGYVPGMPLFVPNQAGLEKAMDSAYAQANLSPMDTAYVETHGIGMILGEIAEANAVGKGMNKPQKRDTPILVGSLKPNFGHQEAASGIFVLIKAALMTETGVIPGHADFQTPHPAIDLDALNVKVQTETIAWPENFSSRRMGLSSYGWSGTNAHILVEDVKPHHPGYTIGQARSVANYDHSTNRPHLVTFSANNAKSLLKNIARHESIADQYFVSDLAYTLNVRRSKFSHRAFTIAYDDDKAAFAPSSISFGVAKKLEEQPKIGYQVSDPSDDLLSVASEFISFPAFSTTITKLDKILELTGNDIKLQSYVRGHDTAVSTGTDVLAQVYGMAIQIACIDLLSGWNIHPDVVVEREGGEALAAYIAGNITAAAALLSPTSSGEALDKMLAKLGKDDDWRKPSKSVASINGNIDSDEPGLKVNVMIELGKKHVAAASAQSCSSDLNTTDVVQTTKESHSESLLETVGKLYLEGYPVNLEQVNKIHGVEWEPLLIVDLPAYQWDHSKSYSTDTYANQEQRDNKHPYHDLLGRRVFGLSPDTMIWKNKLSFRDLPKSIPWEPNPKPLTELGAAHFISMAAEALSQGFENDGSINVVVEDFMLQDKLVYSEDCNLIETQTSIAKLRSPAPGKSAYRYAVDSIKEGKWTAHCEATIVLDSAAKPQQNTQETNANDNENDNKTLTTTFEPCLKLPESLGCKYYLHPALIDECLKSTQDNAGATSVKDVSSIARIKFGKPKDAATVPGSCCWYVKTSNHAHATSGSGVDVEMTDAEGDQILILTGVRM